MELNIISVAFITGFIIIYMLSTMLYLEATSKEWRYFGIRLFVIRALGVIPLVNTCILLYYFFNRSSK